MGVSSLDFKLGLRLLRKYPGLTAVGGLAMAFAVGVGASAFEVVKQVIDPVLPFDEGERVVAIRTRDLTAGAYGIQTVRDLVDWREALKTVEQLSGFRTLERNTSVAGGVPQPVQMAEMSASGFRVARVAPLLGRILEESDELSGAASVVVIGYEIWQRRFAGDPSVIGREIRIGSAYASIVGVMPENFAFPIAQHLWLPLRPDRATTSKETLHIFGRLSPGITLERSQVELATVGARALSPESAGRQQLRPVVEPYPLSFGFSFDVPPATRRLFYAVNLFFVMLLVLICANVALLMFARAVTRESEILVRCALGASRSRIVAQLFAEALMLGGVAALIGLGGAHFALGALHRVSEIESEGRLPFWFDASLSPATVLYSVGLTLIAAAVAGVLPALKTTGRKVDTQLRQLAARGGGLRFGRLWTTVIIVQVVVTVAFPAGAFFVRRAVVGIQTMDVGFDVRQFLSARLELDPQTASGSEPSADAFAANYYADTHELVRRLSAEPGVVSVTLTDRLPRTRHPARRVEVETDAGSKPDTAVYHRVANASVDLNYFDALDAPVLAGRAFHSGDLNSSRRVVIVNEPFVQNVFGGRNPIDRRIRYVDAATDQQPWYEIVGVVKDLGMVVDGPGDPGLYHPLANDAFPVHLAVQLRQDPAAFAPRLSAMAASVDPGLRVDNILPLTEAGSSMWLEFDFMFKLLACLSAIALGLSLAGIYAVTSFTVARRTREIGIRVALGADSRRVVAAVLARPLLHIGIGILAGGCVTGALAYGVMRGALGITGSVTVVVYSALMLAVCLLACVVPTRRALRVQPNEALRQD